MSRQSDPSGPWQMGYDWGRLGMPANEGNPFLTDQQRRGWRNGYDAALAAATGTAKTAQQAECQASQSGGSASERNAQPPSGDISND